MQKLEWDSAFFGTPVYHASVKWPIRDEADFSALAAGARRTDAHVVYLFSRNRQRFLESRGVVLADTKTVYSKIVGGAVAGPPISETKSFRGEVNDHLLELAYQSGQHSRFARDPRLNKKFRELYDIWLQKSIDRELADEMFVYETVDGIAGFVTLRQDRGISRIGLIAVDEQQRGKQVGRKLLAAADRWYQSHGVDRCEVVTQQSNDCACRFYERNGYRLKDRLYVYHWWLQPPSHDLELPREAA